MNRVPKVSANLGQICSFSLILLLTLFCLFFDDFRQQARIWNDTAGSPSVETNGSLPNLSGEEAKEYLKKQGLYASLSDAMRAARYSINPTRNTPNRFKADNPRQGFTAVFSKDGIHLVAESKDNEWLVRMNLEGYGYGEKVTRVNSGKLQVQKDKSRIEIQKSGARANQSEIVEWYENSPNGLEQGWTIAERLPGNRADQQLRLVLKLGGDLQAKLAEDGQAISFAKEDDVPILRYDKLKSWDVTGKVLTSRMELKTDLLSILVNEQEAKYPITIDPFFSQTKKLIASDGATNDQFGFSVSISDDTAVVAAYLDDDAQSNSGSAYIFERNTGSANNWGEVAKLTASDAACCDQFGNSVAISGDTVIVGAPLNDHVPQNSGSAYIFERNQGGVNNWGQVKILTASDAGDQDYFAWSVSISGDTAVIGAYRSGGANGTGSAYVFERNTGGADNWGEVKKMTASDASSGAEFGYKISISGDTVIIGALNDFGVGFQSGAAYIFSRNTGGANNWGEVKKLTASDAAANDNFGYSVAISGDTAIVGSRNDDAGGSNSGSAYIFERNIGGANNWGEITRIIASDTVADDSFGHSVSISVDTVIVGANRNDDGGSNSGSAYIFERNTGGADNWGEIQKLTASDAAGGDLFGQSVCISMGTAIVGANGDDDGGSTSGSAYVFTNQDSNWQQISKPLASDGTANDQFGVSVAILGNTAIVGSHGDDDAGSSSGSAYIFKRNTGGADNWGQVKKLTASDAAADDQFGYSVAISGDTAIVGALFNDDAGSNSGSAYIFERNTGGANNWGEVKKLTASDGFTSDEFGVSVAISGDNAIVGAEKDDDPLSSSGSAYIFERNQGGANNWGEVKKLLASDGTANDLFARSVGISGDTAFVGAPGNDDAGSASGSAYIFERNTGGANNWGEVTKLLASDANVVDQFGTAVAISGDTAIVGAFGNDDVPNTSGSAYIFERNNGGADNWGEVKKILASDADTDDRFGWSVAISGDTAIVGAYQNDDSGFESGSAYIFERNQSGADNWGELTKLTASDAAGDDRFGQSVAISDEFAIVGANRADISALSGPIGKNRFGGKSNHLAGADQGAAYIFNAVTAPTTPSVAPFDFDGDGKTDIGIFRPSNGQWWINRSTAGLFVPTLGVSTDEIAPADYDGDGLTDVAVWRPGAPTAAAFYILNSSDFSLRIETLGQTGDNPVVTGDWDGDGKADPAVYRDSASGSQSRFYFLGSDSNPSGDVTYLDWGSAGDEPQAGDYDGDGKRDLAIFRPSAERWIVRQSSDGMVRWENFGLGSDKRLAGDFDGDGKTDLALFRPSDNTWYYRQSSDAAAFGIPFGTTTDQLAPGDYDGDGKTDPAVYRDGLWYILESNSGGLRLENFGLAGDKAIPSFAAFD